jgi:hypothetical protein
MLIDRNPILGSWFDLENSLPFEYLLPRLQTGIQVISSRGDKHHG